jgi:glutathione-specific gamma-glutamylcyclotransferase
MVAPRQMRLTSRHVALLKRDIPDPGLQVNHLPGFRPANDEDYAENVAGMLRECAGGPFWLFGYGSLIWKPETAYVEHKIGIARGLHRRFCLGWDYRYRGSHEAPGLMLALDRGGTCKGILYRLPDEGLEAELHKLIRREMSMVPSSFPWRFIEVVTLDGPVRAITFAMNRKSGRYIAGMTDEQVADILSKACGFRGSMAEYLFQTVSKLEELGIHDKNLWRMQELVAERIDAAYPPDQEV